jgi:co-chaperonin GroES (HSP10)
MSVRFNGDDIERHLLPVPAGWRILVGMLEIKSESDGGILLMQETVDGKGYLRKIGKVLAVGSQAYKKDSFQNGVSLDVRSPDPWAKVGDIVLIGQYAGEPLTYKNNVTLKLLNDDEVIAVLSEEAFAQLQF